MLDPRSGWQPTILEVASNVSDNQVATYVVFVTSRAYRKYHAIGTNHAPTAMNRHQCISKTGMKCILTRNSNGKIHGTTDIKKIYSEEMAIP